jgi:hypothetical protein
MSKDLDYLGEFLMKHFRDVALECAEGLCEGRFDSPGHRRFQKELEPLPAETKKLIQESLAYCLDGAMNDFLFHVDAESRKKKRLQLFVDGVDATKFTEGLHRELHGDDGWMTRFSSFAANTAK